MIFGEAGEADLKPWFLIAALMLAFGDLIAGMILRGLVPSRAIRTAAGVALMAMVATPALAQETTTSDDGFALAATLESRFGFIMTGDSEIDGNSRDGLFGLGIVLAARTSIEPAEPMALEGKSLLEDAAQCWACHAVSGSKRAKGSSGPNLTHLASRGRIGAGLADNTQANLRLWIEDPANLKPGTIMARDAQVYTDADKALTDSEVSAIVAYLRTLK